MMYKCMVEEYENCIETRYIDCCKSFGNCSEFLFEFTYDKFDEAIDELNLFIERVELHLDIIDWHITRLQVMVSDEEYKKYSKMECDMIRMLQFARRQLALIIEDD